MPGAFDIDRIALTGGVRTPVRPRYHSRTVQIMNLAVADTLEVHSSPTGSDNFFSISPGFAQFIDLSRYGFLDTETSFWLEIANTTTVALLWSR